MTGQTAASYDSNEMMTRSLPLVFEFVLTLGLLSRVEQAAEPSPAPA